MLYQHDHVAELRLHAWRVGDYVAFDMSERRQYVRKAAHLRETMPLCRPSIGGQRSAICLHLSIAPGRVFYRAGKATRTVYHAGPGQSPFRDASNH